MSTIPQYTYQPGIPLDDPGDGVFPAGYAAQGPGVIAIGQFLYAVTNSLANSSLELLQSDDRGLSWTELDAAHHPTNPDLSSFCVFYSQQAATTIWVCYVNANSGPADLIIQKFNTATGLWVGPVASTVSTLTVLAMFVRTDSTIAVINEPVCDGLISGLQISVLDLTAHWTSYDLGSGAVGVGMPPPLAGANLDAAISIGFDGSTVYCFYNTNQASPYTYACFFQSFSITNTLVNFFQFPNTAVATDPDLRVSNGSPMGQPAINGATIYLPVARSSYSSGAVNYPSLYISFNSGATWSEMGLQNGTDPAANGPQLTQDSVIFAGQAVLVLGQLWIVYSAQLPNASGPPSSYIRLCVLPAGMNPLLPANWTASTMQSLSEYASSPFATFSWPTISVLFNPPDVLLYGELYNGTESLAYWFGNFFPAIAVLPIQPGPVINLPYCTGPNIRSFF